jgi:hypothetical protein
MANFLYYYKLVNIQFCIENMLVIFQNELITHLYTSKHLPFFLLNISKMNQA